MKNVKTKTELMQQMFNKAARGVIKQGKPSRNKDGACLYRGPDNCRCVVGHLITNKEYNHNMENKSAGALLVNYDFPAGKSPNFDFFSADHPFQKVGPDFLGDLQRCHDAVLDDENFVSAFKERMLEVATKYNLDAKVLK
jgi:hypothetical protein